MVLETPYSLVTVGGKEGVSFRQSNAFFYSSLSEFWAAQETSDSSGDYMFPLLPLFDLSIVFAYGGFVTWQEETVPQLRESKIQDLSSPAVFAMGLQSCPSHMSFQWRMAGFAGTFPKASFPLLTEVFGYKLEFLLGLSHTLSFFFFFFFYRFRSLHQTTWHLFSAVIDIIETIAIVSNALLFSCLCPRYIICSMSESCSRIMLDAWNEGMSLFHNSPSLY